ncbi:MAG: carbamoylphosphate synthase large subunit [Clostridia bacterium]|nr:carbamoylphosphate synthase large subunit [Clostridia bacterium]
MKNFVFISPNFPTNYWRFCDELKNDGFNVLGIGDCPYDNLPSEVKNSLKEYYWVSSLENYDEVYRAVAFYIFIYGKVDYIESNNEYWLERDALLRTAFNVKTGFLQKDIKKIKLKSQMKKYYTKAGVKVAKHCLVKTVKNCLKFTAEVGYPVIVKPDNGVGANNTYKLNNDKEVEEFVLDKPDIPYIMEEYIDAEVNSYDAIIDSKGNPVFETGNVSPISIMDIVNNYDNSAYYMVNQLAPDVQDAGRRTVKAFGVKSRFVHFEFFRLTRDQRIGKKGEVVALEVNMRPCGGFSPDMMNYANSTNVYKIWADIMAYDKTELTTGDKYFCAYAGRRDGKEFVYDEQEIIDKYWAHLKSIERIPDALSPAMGNLMFLANFTTKKELDEFYSDVLKVK